MEKLTEEYKRLRLSIMAQLQHPESYYQQALKSQGVNFVELDHAEICIWKATLLSIEADALIIVANNSPVSDFGNSFDRLDDRMTQATSQH